MNKLKIAIFASGSGSNFQAIVDEVQAGRLPVTIALLVCDRPAAKVVQRAAEANIPSFVFRPKDYESRDAYERDIRRQLEERGVELIVLAGYMRLITDQLLVPYAGKMINIHPSLLPSFPGVDSIAQALAYGVKWTGVTVHFVDGGMDTGPIIAQSVVAVQADDDEEQLAMRIHAEEHRLFPQVIDWFCAGRVELEGRKVTVKNKE